jgi:aminopeptidase N
MKYFFLCLYLPVAFMSPLKSQKLEEIWSEGLQMFSDKNFHGCIEKMNQVIRLFPSFSDAYYNRGIARLNLGDVEGACRDISLANEQHSKEADSYFKFLCDSAWMLKMLKEYYYKRTKLYPETGYRPHYTLADTLRGSLRPERICFDVFYYDLRVKIFPKGQKIQGTNEIYFKINEPASRIQIDLFDNYKVDSIIWKGRKLVYKRKYNALFIDFPTKLLPGEKHNISITYSGKPVAAPNPPWDGGFVWKKRKKSERWVGVACEHLGASSWWPNKDHLSDKPDSMLIKIEVPENFRAVANGVLREVKDVGKKYKQYAWFVSYPINNYNVTFYMGKYTEFTDTLATSDGPLLLRYNVFPENLEKAKAHFEQVKEILPVYIDLFGPYPFMRDGYGLVESLYEGMEHQTAIAYGNAYDKPNRQEYRDNKYDFIIVHESAHEWWGNAVTAADMADIWLHEGFATYAEYLFLERIYGKEEYLHEISLKSNYIYNFWPLVQHRDVNENSFASNDVYNKGAMLLHCLRCTINNDSLFFKIIKDFNVLSRYRALASDDFITMVNNYTGNDYRPFFNKFLYDKALPVLSYSYENIGDKLIIKYKWAGVEDGFTMPFGIETSDNKAYRLEATTTERETIFENVSWFNFYNQWKGYEGCTDHSYTYFRTDCQNFK